MALVRAFRKEMGRSPNPGEMNMLKKKASEMEQSDKIIPFPPGGKDRVDPFKDRPKVTSDADELKPKPTLDLDGIARSKEPRAFGDNIRDAYRKKGASREDANKMIEAMDSPGGREATKIMEKSLGMKLYGDETFEELMQIKKTGKHPRGEPKAEGGLIREAEKYATQKESEFLKSVDIDNIPRTGNLQREQERAYENAYREYMERNKKAEGGIMGLAEGGPSDPGRRRFIKILGGLASIPVLGRFIKPVTEVAPVVAEGVKTVPSYFFKLVDKIKTLGDDAPGITTTEREVGKKYKDYELVEDLSSGDIVVKKNKEGGAMFGDEYETGIMQEEVMAYRPRKKTPEGELPEDYQEITARPSMPDGSMDDFDDGLDSLDDILEEVGEKRAKQAGGGIAYLLGE